MADLPGRAGSWAAPERVEQFGDTLLFRGTWRPVALTDAQLRDMLDDFLSLADADDAAVLAFARRYGALSACSVLHDGGKRHPWLLGPDRSRRVAPSRVRG